MPRQFFTTHLEITVGPKRVGLLRIVCRHRAYQKNCSKPFFRKFSKKVTRGHRTGEAIEIEEQTRVPRASGLNHSAGLCRNRWRCRSRSAEVAEDERTRERPPSQTSTDEIGLPLHNFRKSTARFLIFLKRTCVRLMVQASLMLLDDSEKPYNPTNFLRQQSVKVERRLEDPMSSQTVTILVGTRVH